MAVSNNSYFNFCCDRFCSLYNSVPVPHRSSFVDVYIRSLRSEMDALKKALSNNPSYSSSYSSHINTKAQLISFARNYHLRSVVPF